MDQQQPVWLEVALNGAAGTAFQPKIPITVDAIIAEGIACANAGAAIVHVHAYNALGQGVEDADVYTRIIEGIRAQVDVIVYPTLSLFGDLKARYGPVQTLIDRGLLEWGVVDPGSVNITHTSQIAAAQDGIAYLNPDGHIRYGLALAQSHQWRPAYAIYEPGFVRLGAAMAAQFPQLRQPVYRLMLSDNLLFGMPPSAGAVRYYAQLLQHLAPQAPWMLSGLDANLVEFMPLALELGGHLRVGLEDAPFGSMTSNLALVENAVREIERQPRPLASVAQIRAHR